MLKKIALVIAGLGFIISTHLSAAHSQLMTMGMNITYKLTPNEPLELYNFTFWTISAICKISTIDEVDKVKATLLNRTGIINGQELNTGDVIHLSVRHGDNLQISASSRAKVELINHGEHELVAACST